MAEYINLTTDIIKKIPYTKKKQILIRDDIVRGFTVRIGAKTKTYCIHKNVNGKFISKTIGKFGQISLKDARDKAKELLYDLNEGWPLAENMITGDMGPNEASSPEEFIAKIDVCSKKQKWRPSFLTYITILITSLIVFSLSLMWNDIINLIRGN
jgi:hypothetical protein